MVLKNVAAPVLATLMAPAIISNTAQLNFNKITSLAIELITNDVSNLRKSFSTSQILLTSSGHRFKFQAIVFIYSFNEQC